VARVYDQRPALSIDGLIAVVDESEEVAVSGEVVTQLGSDRPRKFRRFLRSRKVLPKVPAARTRRSVEISMTGSDRVSTGRPSASSR
jgi:hypothetical protein